MRRNCWRNLVFSLLAILLLTPGACLASAGPTAAPAHAGSISLLWAIPFVLLLASIALMPFIHRHWWEKYYPAIAVGLGVVASCYYWFLAPSAHGWIEAMRDYVSFIILLTSLFVVSGGIVIHVPRQDTPVMNSVLLLFGAVLANFFGTTGASMLLIRPYLRMNKGHVKPFHIVFFIFIVSNVGGLLTPIGDPPLYLGYLKGVPFWWVLKQARWAWLVTVGILLVIFFIIDSIDHGKRTPREPDDAGPAIFIHGVHNFLFIALIVWAVFQPGFFELLDEAQAKGYAGMFSRFVLCREALMLVASLGSYLATSRTIYHKNEFTYAPIREVAILFIGIFATMAPALQWLRTNAETLPLKTPGQYYFTSGALSAVLDNAPTYLTFLQVQVGQLEEAKGQKIAQAVAELEKMTRTQKLEIDPTLDPEVRKALGAMVQYHSADILSQSVLREPIKVRVAFLLADGGLSLYVIAISLGAVFFGACTYIGNGPNFMVKSIAESAGVPTPSFLGYIVYYTLPVLVPVYVLVWFVFLR